ncbi:hypothetical protein EVA_14419 [gut metagenome]|uniref:Uncharacterized protein n=1 Tax=gut metagenome TaxID=749906 RepID=J9GDM1_9ZZZZ
MSGGGKSGRLRKGPGASRREIRPFKPNATTGCSSNRPRTACHAAESVLLKHPDLRDVSFMNYLRMNPNMFSF